MSEWRLIAEAKQDEDIWILASSGGKIPFVTGWDDGWYTFNLCFESTIGKRTGRKWEPTHWMPLPAAPP